MRVTVVHIITNLRQEGAQRILQYVVTSSRVENRHIVVSLTNAAKDCTIGEILEQHDIEVIYLTGTTRLSIIRKLFALFQVIQRYKPDIVQTWMYHADLIGGIAAKILGTPKIIWSVHHDNPNTTKLSTKLVATVCSWISGIVPSIIVNCSRSALQAHVTFGYKKEKMCLIENGICLEKFSLASERSYQKSDFYIIGHIARWHPIKGHETFINAASIVFQKMPNLKFMMIGTGIDDKNTELKSLLNKAGISEVTSLLGEQQDIPQLLTNMDVYVQSSFSESFSLTLVEAIAMGVPSVSTRTGIAMDIDDSLCKKVDVNDQQALAEAILGLLHMTSEAKEAIVSGARKAVVERFDQRVMVDKYQRLYSNVS